LILNIFKRAFPTIPGLDSSSSHATALSIVRSSSSQQSSTKTSPVSSFIDPASSANTSDSSTSALAPSRSSTSAVFISGSPDDVQLLGVQRRFDIDATMESDSGHSTEVTPANSTQTPPNVPNEAYRELIDEPEQEQPVGSAGAHNEQGERLQGHGNPVGDLQVPQMLFTEATLSASSGSEMVSSSEPSEGRTHLLQCSGAEEVSITAKEGGGRTHPGIVFKIADSDEDVGYQLNGKRSATRLGDNVTLPEEKIPCSGPNISQSCQNVAMNISAISPADDREAAAVHSPIFVHTPPAEGCRRSGPSDLHTNAEGALKNCASLTKSYSVDTLHKGLECLSTSQQPGRVLTSSPIVTRTNEPESFELSKPLQRWREEFRQRIFLQNARELKAVEELRMEAKRSLEKWYSDRQVNITARRRTHLERETALRSFRSDEPRDPKSAWNRLVSLALDAQQTHKADDVSKDVSRMRELLKILKFQPPFRKVDFTCIDPNKP
ncbi:hypothetical protein BIW11_08827, partial [Tropilaelaps mercedesae]